ncbi:MAG: aldo/keto reductase [Spirochaetes bacterium]|jgi:aryl-alcohol dehydrogenase-like predicted oxidoreductase|nr:aldo/keto reductase [Spirochaetota bacterium]
MKRTLGRSGIELSALGMGCWAIGGPFHAGEQQAGWGTVDDAESTRAIRAALDMGVTFFDTADVYGAGHSERVLGEALGAEKNSVVIATKFGNVFDEATKEITGNDASPEYIRAACDASLRRLGRDYIDLLQLHINDYDMEKAPEVRDALESLVDAGKIRGYGWSTDWPERAAIFAEGRACTSVQFQMNVLDDNPEMRAFCKRENLAAINRGPLAMGLLTGKYDKGGIADAEDVRGPNSPDWMKYFVKGQPSREFLAKVAAIRDILTSNGRSLVQGALAWIWARSPLTIPIPGFKSVKQVQENAGAMAHGPLTTEQVDEIDRLLER